MNMPQHYLLVDFHFKDGTILENCHVLDETTGYPFKDIDKLDEHLYYFEKPITVWTNNIYKTKIYSTEIEMYVPKIIESSHFFLKK